MSINSCLFQFVLIVYEIWELSVNVPKQEVNDTTIANRVLQLLNWQYEQIVKVIGKNARLNNLLKGPIVLKTLSIWADQEEKFEPSRDSGSNGTSQVVDIVILQAVKLQFEDQSFDTNWKDLGCRLEGGWIGVLKILQNSALKTKSVHRPVRPVKDLTVERK